ncbi:MAG TPA: phasin family protein [Xanthobacteraceae bacterium]|jgi:phasin
MNETTTAATKAKTTKPVASPLGVPDYGMPKFEMPKFGLANTEMPEAFREMTEKGVAHAGDAYAKARVASEEAADLLENTYTAVAKGVADYNLKLIEISRTNTRAAFDYAHELMGVKSASEFIELLTAQTRKQFDIASAQNKELYALAQLVTTKAAEPIKIGLSKAFNEAS